MKKIALFWLIMLLFPADALISSFYTSGPSDQYVITAYMFITQLFAFEGYGLSNLLYRLSVRNRMLSFFIMTAAGCGTIAVLSVFINEKLFFILCLVSYLIGAAVTGLNFTACVSSVNLIASLSTCAVIMTWLRKSGGSDNTMFSCFIMLADTLMFIFLRNLKNVENLMSARNYDRKYLPAQVKKSNSRFALLMCLPAAASVLLISPAASLAGRILNMIRELLSRLLKRTVQETEFVPPEPVDSTPPFQAAEGSGNNIFLLIINILIVVFLVIFIRENYDIIADIFSGIFISARKTVRKIITARSVIVKDPDNTGFTDITEDIDEIRSEDMASSSANKWKKLYARFRSMPAGKEKYRCGYRLLLILLNISGQKIISSDTPDEIAETVDEKSFSDVTGTYDAVRYGNADCSVSNIEYLENTISEYKKKIL